MSEETPKETSLASAEGVAKFLEKNGLSTFLLLAVLYVGWTSFLSPAAEKYMQLLDSVAESNTSLAATVDDLRLGLREVGEKNVVVLQENKDNIRRILEKVDELEDLSKEISRKLDDLRPGRGAASLPGYPSAGNIQEPATD